LLPPVGAPPEPEDDPDVDEVEGVEELPEDELSPLPDSFWAAVPFDDEPDFEPARLSVR
jgi:hypothetical protein